MKAPQINAAIEQLKPRFFEGLTPAEIGMVLSAAAFRRYPANSVIVHQGDSADRLFLLLTGRARFFSIMPDGQKVLYLRLAPGEIFGGAAFMAKPEEYLVSTEAVMDSTALVWNRPAIRGLAKPYPRLVENALLLMFDYLVFYKAVHTSLICHTARQRLAQVLSNLAHGIGQKVSDGVELDILNEELANEANVTPFTTSRLLSEWQRKGLVVKTRGKLLVRSPEQLSLSEVYGRPC